MTMPLFLIMCLLMSLHKHSKALRDSRILTIVTQEVLLSLLMTPPSFMPRTKTKTNNRIRTKVVNKVLIKVSNTR